MKTMLKKIDVIKFFESHGRKLALHESLRKSSLYKYTVSDYLTGVLIVNSKTKAGAFRDAHKIMQQAVEKNHDFSQYVEYNSVDFKAGVDFVKRSIGVNSKAFIEGLKHGLTTNNTNQ